MGYQGNYPPSTPLTSSQIGAGAVDTTALATDAVTTVDIANGAVTIPKISATGTASSSTFLRGDGAWGAAKMSLAAVQTTGFTAVANTIYPCNTTSGAFTVTLPASPSANDQITIIDYAGTAATNNITISPNGNKINGSTSSTIISVNRAAFDLIYVDSTQGWILYAAAVQTSFSYSVDYLVVAGGGSGGWQIGGGGGAGGYLSSTAVLAPSSLYTITVGAGATGSTGLTGGGNGSNSLFGSIATAIGGGKGGNNNNDQTSGGSGGGAGEYTAVAAGTAGQGNAGGAAFATANYGSGGGGGAGAVGGDGGSSSGGAGGAGLNWQSLGTFYAGGGGGGLYNGGGAAGGSGGGGAAGASAGATGSAGSANTGGGGGGGTYNTSGAVNGNGGSGGSGIVIIRYLGSQRGTGGTVTSAGGYTYHTFTSSGTYTA